MIGNSFWVLGLGKFFRSHRAVDLTVGDRRLVVVTAIVHGWLIDSFFWLVGISFRSLHGQSAASHPFLLFFPLLKYPIG